MEEKDVFAVEEERQTGKKKFENKVLITLEIKSLSYIGDAIALFFFIIGCVLLWLVDARIGFIICALTLPFAIASILVTILYEKDSKVKNNLIIYRGALFVIYVLVVLLTAVGLFF